MDTKICGFKILLLVIKLTCIYFYLQAYTNTNEKMVDFLGHLPEPPGYYSVQQAVKKLQDMRALTETEELTPLGKRIYLFTLDPLLSKAVVYAALFK